MATFKTSVEVIKSSKTDFDVDTGKRKLKFGRSGGMVITDPGEARAVEERYGHKSKYRASWLRAHPNEPAHEVVTMAVDDVRVEAGHKYSFGRHIPMPWASYCEVCGRRIDKGEILCPRHKEMEIYDGEDETGEQESTNVAADC